MGVVLVIVYDEESILYLPQEYIISYIKFVKVVKDHILRSVNRNIIKMEAIGIIFFACLAFAIAILILITCCFLKVNGGKDSGDLEMSKSATIRRMHQTGYNKSVNDEVSKQNPNVILFLKKKSKYSSDSAISKQNLNNSNGIRRIDDVDGITDEGYQNDADNESSNHIHGGCQPSNVSNSSHGHGNHSGSDHGIGRMLQSHGNSNHVGGTHHQSHTSRYDHGIGHFNEGFSSKFSSSHHGGGWGHHSGDSGHHGCDGDIGDNGGDGDD